MLFAFELSLGSGLEAFIRQYGFVPLRVSTALAEPNITVFLDTLPIFATSQFLHGGWFHIIGNMLYLRVFGDNIEGRLGHLGYFVFYLFAGAVGMLAQYIVDPASEMPVVGASGAIAGVLGAYIIVFPTVRIITLFPVFIFLTSIELPAFVFLGVWAMQQLLNSFMVVAGFNQSPIAWLAHLGGFGFGALVGVGIRIRGKKTKRRSL